MTKSDQTSASKAEEPTENTPVIAGPLVFNCGKCHTIIGDSYSFVGTHSQLKTITLSAASKVTRNESLITSQSSVDKGSTYVALMCYNCSKVLGRYYITTPKALDELREKFTFFVDEISSYELGKPEYGDSLSQPSPAVSSSNNGGLSDELLEPWISKVHHVILGLEERILRIEGFLQIQPQILADDVATIETEGEKVTSILYPPPAPAATTSSLLPASSLSSIPLNTSSNPPPVTEDNSTLDYWTNDANDTMVARKKARR